MYFRQDAAACPGCVMRMVLISCFPEIILIQHPIQFRNPALGGIGNPDLRVKGFPDGVQIGIRPVNAALDVIRGDVQLKGLPGAVYHVEIDVLHHVAQSLYRVALS